MLDGCLLFRCDAGLLCDKPACTAHTLPSTWHPRSCISQRTRQKERQRNGCVFVSSDPLSSGHCGGANRANKLTSSSLGPVELSVLAQLGEPRPSSCVWLRVRSINHTAQRQAFECTHAKQIRNFLSVRRVSWVQALHNTVICLLRSVFGTVVSAANSQGVQPGRAKSCYELSTC